MIEDPAGPVRRRLARSFDDLTSRMPCPQEAAALLLSQGVPVIRVFDTGDVLVEVQDMVAAAGRHEWRYEVSLNGEVGPGPR